MARSYPARRLGRYTYRRPAYEVWNRRVRQVKAAAIVAPTFARVTAVEVQIASINPAIPEARVTAVIVQVASIFVQAVPISGSAPSSAGTTGNLSGSVHIEGKAPAAAGTTGRLSGPVRLTGSAPAAAGTTGNLGAAVHIAGSAPAAAGTTGLLLKDGEILIAGSASAAAGTTGVLSGPLALDLELVWVVWNTTTNDPPTPVPIPTDGIKQAIFGAVTDITRQVDIYEADGTTPFMLNAPLISGSVGISMSAGERRTFDLTLYNELGNLDFYPGGFWYDKIIKIYRGAVTSTETWQGQLGTFMIDRIETNNQDSTVSISGRDFTKKLINSKFAFPVFFPANEPIENIISAIATNGGVTDQSLPLTGENTQVGWTFNQGTERWKAIKDIATAFDFDLYFDETGTLVLTEFADIINDAIAFVFQTGAAGNLSSFRKTTSDARLRNHIVVIGENADQEPVIGEAENNNGSSPTRIALIGRRTETYNSAYVGNVAGANALAQRFLTIAGLEQFEVPLDGIVIPWLDVNNVVTFTDPDPAPGDPTRFLLTDMTIPLGLTAMSATVRRIVNVL